MNVLVVGGAGFIGHIVAQEFVAHGHLVTVVDNMTNYGVYEQELHNKKLAYRRHKLSGCTVYECDITTDFHLLNGIFMKHLPNIVINLANNPVAGVAVSQPYHTANTMVNGLITLLELSKDYGVDRFTHVSSSMVYGNFTNDPITEEDDCNPLDIYGNLKLTGERLVRSWTRLHGLKHSIVRPSACYGPTGNEAFVVTKFLRAARAGGEITVQGADVELDFTYVSDIAHGIYLAAILPQANNETFNITYGQKRTLLEVAEYLKVWYPAVTIDVTYPDPLYPKRGQLSIEKAKTLLGYKPKIHLEKGLAVYINHTLGYRL